MLKNKDSSALNSDIASIMLINYKMPTIHNIEDHDTFHAQFSWTLKKIYNLRAMYLLTFSINRFDTLMTLFDTFPFGSVDGFPSFRLLFPGF